MRINKVTRYDKDMVNFDIMEGNELIAHVILAKNGDYFSSPYYSPVKRHKNGDPVFNENGTYALENGLWEEAEFIWSHIAE